LQEKRKLRVSWVWVEVAHNVELPAVRRIGVLTGSVNYEQVKWVRV